MLRSVVELIANWSGKFNRLWIKVLWRIILHCLMWLIWRERNACTFEGIERSIHELKLLAFTSFFFLLCVIGQMLRVFFLSFLYLICLIFVLALLLNFFNVASSTRPVWSCFCRNYIVYCWFKAVDKYHFVICTKVIDIHIFWIRFCTWIGMIIMEESQHHLILFRSHLKIFEVTYQKKKKKFLKSHFKSAVYYCFFIF